MRAVPTLVGNSRGFEPHRGHMETGGFLYIIQCEETGRFYIGSCICVKKRITDHNRGNTRSTKPYGPWKLVYCEKYSYLKDARKRERQIKRWKSRVVIMKLIQEQSRL